MLGCGRRNFVHVGGGGETMTLGQAYLEEFLVAHASVEDLLDEDFLVGVRELNADSNVMSVESGLT